MNKDEPRPSSERAPDTRGPSPLTHDEIEDAIKALGAMHTFKLSNGDKPFTKSSERR